MQYFIYSILHGSLDLMALTTDYGFASRFVRERNIHFGKFGKFKRFFYTDCKLTNRNLFKRVRHYGNA